MGLDRLATRPRETLAKQWMAECEHPVTFAVFSALRFFKLRYILSLQARSLSLELEGPDMGTPASSGYAGARSSAVFTPKPAVTAHHDSRALLDGLASKLRNLIEVQTIQVTLYAFDRGEVLLRFLDPPREGAVAEIEGASDGSPAHVVWREQQPMLVSASKDGARFPKYVVWMRRLGLQAEWVVPVTSPVRRLGTIGFGLINGRQYTQSELTALESIANGCAVESDDILNLQEAKWTRAELARERDNARLLLEINNALVTYLDLDELWKKIAECLLAIVPHEFAGIALYDGQQAALCRLGSGGGASELFPDGYLPIHGSVAGSAFQSGKPIVIAPDDIAAFPKTVLHPLVARKCLGSGCMLPLISHNRKLGVLGLVSRRKGAFGPEQVALLTGVAAQISIAVENALSHRELERLKNKLYAEKQYLNEEVQACCDFELIGNSEAFLRVLRQVEVVAPTDSTILIQGETGSGKEILATAIHKLSERRDRTLVKVNCSAIPTGLLESELFGHEKGAFTGAIARRIGRFELAHQGTIFLDEVGDIPRELQPKLLRVLQEKEFERIGGARTIQVDVRIVAATNADLAQMVANKEFRSDLYYRLNVFPITVPPLRERPEDIVPLALRFARNFARRMKKPVETIPPHVQQALTRYRWPGNIRELQNVIERAVILSKSSVLEVPLAELTAVTADVTLAGAEREYILRILRETDWRVSGKRGAARRLGLNRSTLQSKMRKLGIRRPV